MHVVMRDLLAIAKFLVWPSALHSGPVC